MSAREHHRGEAGGAGGEAGFTLLEVMVAIAILGLTIVPIIEGHMLAVAAANHAKMTTIGVQLAREKIIDFETQLQLTGFCLNSEDVQEGDFSEEGFGRFKWKTQCEKIELPTGDKMQGAIKNATTGQAAATGEGGFSGLGAAGVVEQAQGNMASMATQIPFIQNILETAVRRVTVTVSWRERGKWREIPVATYLVDLKAAQVGASFGAAPGTATGTGTGSKTGASGSTGTGTNSGSNSSTGTNSGSNVVPKAR